MLVTSLTHARRDTDAPNHTHPDPAGATYRATGAAAFLLDQQPSSLYQFGAFFRLFPTDPARLFPTDPVLPLSFSVSLDSAGRISTAIARVGSGSPFGD